MEFDFTGFRFVHVGWKSAFADRLFALLSYSGLGLAVGLAAIALAFSSRTRFLTGPILASIILGGTVFAQTAKTLLPRLRPSNLNWAMPQEPHLHSSFPSAHTACGFAAATVISVLLWNRGLRWPSLPLMLWATGIGFSRIYRGVHWPTDTLAGASLGIAAGFIVASIFIYRSHNSESASNQNADIDPVQK